MPGPLLPDPQHPDLPQLDDGPFRPAARPRPRPAASHVADPGLPTPRRHDADADDLAMALPEWDLVPPTEFVVRHRRPR